MSSLGGLGTRRPVRATALFALTASLLCTGCQSNDLGRPCGDDAPPIPAQAVDGEEPVIEVVRLQRDSACETFQCLTHRGLAPYCTRECEKKSDCPVGFVCEQVQEQGPLALKKYCVFERACGRNIDCGDLGNIRCAKLGCLDACSLQPVGCEFHALHCEERSDLGCECLPDQLGNPRDTCDDVDLVCTPASLGTTLPTGSVAQLNVCVPVDE
ncbi:MAG: hypothetical protein AAB426_14145 [Myxococcota bacterium]